MFDVNRDEARSTVSSMEQMIDESQSKIPLMQLEYKIRFLEREITKLRQYLLKTYAKMGVDKTKDEVSPINILHTSCIQYTQFKLIYLIGIFSCIKQMERYL